MKMIALIDDDEVIDLPALPSGREQAGKILRHLDLWPAEALPARAPPKPVIQDYMLEPFFDDMPLEATL